MYKAIQTTHEINAPIDTVWSLIKTGANWEDWLPILKGSRVEGNSRFCDLENGDTLEEIFLASTVEKTFIYTIHKQQSFPAENIVGIMKLETINEHTQLKWSVEMDVENEETFQALKEQISQVYTASAAKLGELATSTVKI
jgi:uncharacterized protein YndB with AHSA1/START domain